MYLSIYLSIYLFIYISLSIYLSIYLYKGAIISTPWSTRGGARAKRPGTYEVGVGCAL